MEPYQLIAILFVIAVIVVLGLVLRTDKRKGKKISDSVDITEQDAPASIFKPIFSRQSNTNTESDKRGRFPSVDTKF